MSWKNVAELTSTTISEALIRVDTIEGLFQLSKRGAFEPGSKVPVIISALKAGPSSYAVLDYEGALFLAESIDITGALRNVDNRSTFFRHVLKVLIQAIRPPWIAAMPYGRSRVLRAAPPNHRQCLQYAGLLDPILTPDALSWWDEMAASERLIDDERKNFLGRLGEGWSMAHERHRLAGICVSPSPVWKAVEDNSAGFDVKSVEALCDQHGGVVFRDIIIEVKTSSITPPVIHISRHEWNTALRDPTRFRLHVWTQIDRVLRVYSVDEVGVHIPVDHGDGKWSEVQVSLDR